MNHLPNLALSPLGNSQQQQQQQQQQQRISTSSASYMQAFQTLSMLASSHCSPAFGMVPGQITLKNHPANTVQPSSTTFASPTSSPAVTTVIPAISTPMTPQVNYPDFAALQHHFIQQQQQQQQQQQFLQVPSYHPWSAVTNAAMNTPILDVLNHQNAQQLLSSPVAFPSPSFSDSNIVYRGNGFGPQQQLSPSIGLSPAEVFRTPDLHDSPNPVSAGLSIDSSVFSPKANEPSPFLPTADQDLTLGGSRSKPASESFLLSPVNSIIQHSGSTPSTSAAAATTAAAAATAAPTDVGVSSTVFADNLQATESLFAPLDEVNSTANDEVINDASSVASSHDIPLIHTVFGGSTVTTTTAATGDQALFQPVQSADGITIDPFGSANKRIREADDEVENQQEPPAKRALTAKLMHDADKRFQCDICHIWFSRAYNMKTHRKTHFPDAPDARPYQCDVCGKRFTRKHDCARHIDLHKRDKRAQLSCPHCSRKFTRRDILSRHITDTH